MFGGLGILGILTLMLGAFNPEGIGAFGPTSEGIPKAGWEGTLPARLIAVAFPGLVCSASDFLKVWEGGASAVREMMFYPRMMTSPRVRLICLCCPALLVLVMRYSSVSARTTFMCLSKARKVPTIIRASCRVILTRKSIHWRNLLLCVAIFIIDHIISPTTHTASLVTYDTNNTSITQLYHHSLRLQSYSTK